MYIKKIDNILRQCYNKLCQEETAVSRLTAKLSKVMSLLDFYLEEYLDFLNNTRAAIMPPFYLYIFLDRFYRR